MSRCRPGAGIPARCRHKVALPSVAVPRGPTIREAPAFRRSACRTRFRLKRQFMTRRETSIGSTCSGPSCSSTSLRATNSLIVWIAWASLCQ